MTNEELILAEFNAYFEQGQKEAEQKVNESLNIDAVKKWVAATRQKIKVTIIDVTPEGY